MTSTIDSKSNYQALKQHRGQREQLTTLDKHYSGPTKEKIRAMIKGKELRRKTTVETTPMTFIFLGKIKKC